MITTSFSMFDHTQAPRPNFAFVESNSILNLWALSSISISHMYTWEELHSFRLRPHFDHVHPSRHFTFLPLCFEEKFQPFITFPSTFFALSDHPEIKLQPNSHHVVSFQDFPAVSPSYRRHSCQSCDHDVNAQKAPFLLINMIAKRLDK